MLMYINILNNHNVQYERRILIQKFGPVILEWLIPLDHFAIVFWFDIKYSTMVNIT